MNTYATPLSRVAQPLTHLLKTVERHVAIWRLKQELASYEHARAATHRPLHEGHVLATRKLRHDLEALTERRDAPARKLTETPCQHPSCYPERMSKIFN